MDFTRAEQEYRRLKARYDQGELTAKAFESACGQELEIRDHFGRIWQIGVSSGQWYCFEHGSWTQKEPERSEVPAPGHEVEMPEALQPPKKPLTIFDLDNIHSSEDEHAGGPEPAPAAQAKGGAVPRRISAGMRGSASWVLLVGLILLGLVGLAGLGTLLLREQAFGWNPQTPVRFGSPTPTRPPTNTVPAPSATPGLTGTAVPAKTPSPLPGQTFTVQPVYAPRVWNQMQAVYFISSSSTGEDWLSALESAGAATVFEDHNQLSAMKISSPEPFVVFPSGPNAAGQSHFAPIQQEVIFAFPQPQFNPVLTLMCGTQDGEDGYGLRITPYRWELFRSMAGETTILQEAATGLPVQQGAWTSMRLGCLEERLAVWDDAGLAAAVEYSGLPTGRAAVRFETGAPGTAGEVALYFYRLLRLED